MSGAIRSFLGHFAPHAALALCLWIITTMIWSWSVVDVDSDVGLPSGLEAVVVVVAPLVMSVSYLWLRYCHDRRQCGVCDRNGRRDRLRSDPVGLLSRHYHWCRTSPGIWVSIAVWFAFAFLSTVSYVGTFLVYAGMALWLASTIAHQRRLRSCPKHSTVIMYDPRQPRWFSQGRVLAELHSRARGCNLIKAECRRTWCRQPLSPGSILAESPEEVMIWMLAHSNEHVAAYGRIPMVSVQVTLDPHLERDRVAASR